MTPSRYFTAAGIVLLLGAAAMPEAIIAIDIGRSGSDGQSTAIGVWGALVLIVAICGPIMLTFGGILALVYRERGE